MNYFQVGFHAHQFTLGKTFLILFFNLNLKLIQQKKLFSLKVPLFHEWKILSLDTTTSVRDR